MILLNTKSDYFSIQTIYDCTYNENSTDITQMNCPNFVLADIINKLDLTFYQIQLEVFSRKHSIKSLKGATIHIHISWDCNLDFNKTCLPTYHFENYKVIAKETFKDTNSA